MLLNECTETIGGKERTDQVEKSTNLNIYRLLINQIDLQLKEEERKERGKEDKERGCE